MKESVRSVVKDDKEGLQWMGRTCMSHTHAEGSDPI